MFLNKFKLWISAAVILIALALLNLAVSQRIDRIVKEEKLVDEASLQGLPPTVAFTTVALGGFRGLMADLLWLRMASLQDQGKYFEMVQLASWMTKLQPKFTGATSYLAWNMAYNISVTFSSPEDRWRWVQRGIELIRDEALNYNANDPVLYQQLGWIYQHKMGNVLDDAQRYYKFQIAKEMMQAYGGVADPDWKTLAAAPKTQSEFLKKHPGIPEELEKRQFSMDTLYPAFTRTGQLPETLRGIPEAAALENYLRARFLRNYYKLRPETVIEINEKYGELDWRMSESFAIYWATLGIQYSPKRKSIECDRMITQSLKESFVAGRMLLPAGKPTIDYMLIPNLGLVDAVRQTYLDAYERNKRGLTFKSALDNFMIDAIVTLYTYGKYSKSREYFDMMRKERKGDPRWADFERFVLKEWTEDVKDGGYKQAHDLISGMIFSSCLLLGYGDRTAAEAHLKMAYLAYMKFEKSFQDMDRVKMPPFNTMKAEITRACIRNFPNIARQLEAEVKEDAAKEKAP